MVRISRSFFSEGTAYCTGRGEVLRSVDPLLHTYLWIIKPPRGLSTPQVYGRVNVSLLPQRDPEAALESLPTLLFTSINLLIN